jgi:hypothetical protein
MRTTLTLDPDVSRLLENEVHRARKSFKAVVNDALRRGLSPASGARETPKPYAFKPWKAALAPGIDPLRLDEVAQQMEDDATVGKLLGSRRKKRRA